MRNRNQFIGPAIQMKGLRFKLREDLGEAHGAMTDAKGDSAGVGLALHLRRESGEESKFDDVKALQEAAIAVEFILPDDSTVTHEFKKGQTVQVLKSFLEDEYELSQADVALFFRDKLMLDPFSLTDFHGIEHARCIQISVRVNGAARK